MITCETCRHLERLSDTTGECYGAPPTDRNALQPPPQVRLHRRACALHSPIETGHDVRVRS